MPASEVPARRAIFLDRDGVLNEAVVRNGRPYPPGTVEELRVFPDAAGALDRLRTAGYLLLVVTNQPDVARGTQSMESVLALNTALSKQLQIDCFLVCPHDDQDACDCRKPKPGLLLQLATRFAFGRLLEFK